MAKWEGPIFTLRSPLCVFALTTPLGTRPRPTIVAEIPRHDFAEIRFCLFSERDLAVYEAALAGVA